MTTTTDVLRGQHEQVEALAGRFCEAAQDLARVANGTRCGVIPAPTAYALLGRVKIACRHLGEILAALPQGLHKSLTLRVIEVTDYDPETGNLVAPGKSITHATEALCALHAAFEAASRCAEAAQADLANQGWIPVDEQEGLCVNPLMVVSRTISASGPNPANFTNRANPTNNPRFERQYHL